MCMRAYVCLPACVCVCVRFSLAFCCKLPLGQTYVARVVVVAVSTRQRFIIGPRNTLAGDFCGLFGAVAKLCHHMLYAYCCCCRLFGVARLSVFALAVA